ncbi:hypothetical protein G6N05_07275 [Flavobacterium sp. F372]|uniref:Uncharacterized protein n=1 Tax=Flavobacterium bernardetii TaxID=2813823 RepID=A0ABR7IXU4_9FLAO|nr:hypothetical protein [Flavobacterium bernardetii]MBC5834454.1 hypothetical protein [Flavobacterium bernardetii]NHF69907.1 hypothetical protein [Flavobacterium bernardetii]
MEEITNSQFDQFEKKPVNRRALLPVWIKVFCWLFMIMGVAGIACFLIGIFGGTADLSLYGFETNKPVSLLGSLIIALMSFKAFTAYSLWFEKDNAIQLGKIDAIAGIIICFISMVVIPIFVENAGVTLRLELILLLPFYYKLEAIKKAW